MRIYIIGNDGITLCREPPTALNQGEIAVASSEELHAARLSGKRLLALWNALPGVEKRTKVADRRALTASRHSVRGRAELQVPGDVAHCSGMMSPSRYDLISPSVPI